MMPPPSPIEVTRFRALLIERLGLSFDEAALSNLTRILAERVASVGGDYAQYLDLLASTRCPLIEQAALAQALTVTETYFLRNANQFAACMQAALPERLSAAAREGRALHILSFGCASGDEPYSLAIAVREAHPLDAARVRITAADLNPAMLEKARRARYSPWSMRDVPPEILTRWFTPEGNVYALHDEIVAAVTFEQRNLSADDPSFWQADRFDIVFCRNVLMYFSPEQAQAAVRRIAHALVPGGYLFLGHAETLRGLSNDFHVCHTHEAFYYCRATLPNTQAPAPIALRPSELVSFPRGDSSWIETIQRASDRIETLSQLPATPAARAIPNLAPVFELLLREHFDLALLHLDLLPKTVESDPDVLLLKAVLLSHSGALSEAEVACRALLAQDELNAGAHYILALCCEGQGDLAGALEQDQFAVYLDPNFAMARLHLGLLARRRGEHALAARELRRAIPLLQQEEATRLLLFGGGFKREALIALCQAEPARSLSDGGDR